MAEAVLLPKLGQTVEEATIVRWHKKEGDRIEKGDVLFEIETDKAVLEAESFHEGTLLKVLVGTDETVPVSSVVAYVGEPGEEIPEPSPPAVAPSRPDVAPASRRRPDTGETPVPRESASPPQVPTEQAGPAPAAPAAPPVTPARKFVSPRARLLARTHLVDPARVPGTGPNGRVVEKDVQAYIKQHGIDKIRISPTAKRLAARENVAILDVRASGDSGRVLVRDVNRAIAERPVPLTKMRQVIAQRLTQSFTTTPHFYVTVEVDMTELLGFRQKLKAAGNSYTVTDFILESVILSLQEFPALNSVTDGKTVRWHSSVDLGMAVGLEEGLVVPVLRNAEEFTLDELHDSVRAMAARAREGKLIPDEMMGSTFTVSNMGMLDVENFGAIINPGESAILATASTVARPAAVNGKVRIRQIMKMTLSADHRIVDGTLGAGFVNAIKHKLEDIALWKRLTL